MTRLVVFSAILLAIFLRFFHLSVTPSGLYWDELDTGYQAYSLITTGRDYFGNAFPSHLHSFADYRAPLYTYLTVPWVRLLGNTFLAIRITNAVMGIIGVALIYILSRRLFALGRLAFLPALVFAFAPWQLTLARGSAESVTMLTCFLLGVAGFFKSLKNPRWLWVAALGFSLSLWAYSTAKLFVPLSAGLLVLLYWRQVLQMGLPRLLLVGGLFGLSVLPLVRDSVTGNAGMRFKELVVFTDPTTPTQVDFHREQAAVTRLGKKEVGMQTQVWEKAFFNKFTFWGSRIADNYSQVLSSHYLFLRGDPLLRHSPGKNSIGQFHAVELLPFILGLAVLLIGKNLSPKSRLIVGGWLILSPLPSVITRDGGMHATRTIFLFPAVVLIISLGVKFLADHSRALGLSYLLVYTISVFSFGYYFFTLYKSESAIDFNHGFDQAVSLAQAEKSKYDRVILDMHRDSALMAYLYLTRFPPEQFQSMHPLPRTLLLPGYEAASFGNVYILYPGTRTWNYWSSDGTSLLDGSNLLIVGTSQPVRQSLISTRNIPFPNTDPAFYITEILPASPSSSPAPRGR